MVTQAHSLAEAESVTLAEPVRLRIGESKSPIRAATPPRQSTALTTNEVRLLDYLAAGWTSIQIGHRVCRSEKTIRNQLTRIYSKLGAANRAEAVALFLRRDRCA
jgi:DNA-binding NarL/FixJ family response regulator